MSPPSYDGGWNHKTFHSLKFHEHLGYHLAIEGTRRAIFHNIWSVIDGLLMKELVVNFSEKYGPWSQFGCG